MLTHPEMAGWLDHRNFSNQADFPFPILRTGLAPNPNEYGAGYGLKCRGCNDIIDPYFSNEYKWTKDPEFIAIFLSQFDVPEGVDLNRVLFAELCRSRPYGEFIEHIKHCHGVRMLSSHRNLKWCAGVVGEPRGH